MNNINLNENQSISRDQILEEASEESKHENTQSNSISQERSSSSGQKRKNLERYVSFNPEQVSEDKGVVHNLFQNPVILDKNPFAQRSRTITKKEIKPRNKKSQFFREH